jgi:hypothetical protein
MKICKIALLNIMKSQKIISSSIENVSYDNGTIPMKPKILLD